MGPAPVFAERRAVGDDRAARFAGMCAAALDVQLVPVGSHLARCALGQGGGHVGHG
jgi:hypothetical protein